MMLRNQNGSVKTAISYG